MPAADRSLIQLLWKGYNAGSCGYCKDENGRRSQETSGSYYIASDSMSTETYQALVDRGWRRSGKMFYKPDVARSCCPHYTIRLLAASYKPNKDQRQTLNRWNKYVLGEEYMNERSKTQKTTKKAKRQQDQQFDLLATVHDAENAPTVNDIKPAHQFTVEVEDNKYSEEKFQLYRNYQREVHHEAEQEITRPGFRRFLCESPLRGQTEIVDGKERRLGSVHHCYRLDGRLIAMGVLDLLPHGLSGVYFMYHSDFAKWSFGKLSAMTELALTIEGQHQYYYMGYYIHSCAKMRYKGDYKPQQVLDPLSYEWHPLEDYQQTWERGKLAILGKKDWLRQTGPALFSCRDGSVCNYEFPAEVDASEESLLTVGMPGILTIEQLEEFDLGAVSLYFGRKMPMLAARNLPDWEDAAVDTRDTIRGQIAQLVACIGLEVAANMAIDITQ